MNPKSQQYIVTEAQLREVQTLVWGARMTSPDEPARFQALMDQIRRQPVEMSTEENNAMKNPIGTLLSYYGATPPSWAMYCEGQTLKREDYPELYEVLGHTYGGTGDEFNLPDYRETCGPIVMKVRPE
jgi:hypothetical protein